MLGFPLASANTITPAAAIKRRAPSVTQLLREALAEGRLQIRLCDVILRQADLIGGGHFAADYQNAQQVAA